MDLHDARKDCEVVFLEVDSHTLSDEFWIEWVTPTDGFAGNTCRAGTAHALA